MATARRRLPRVNLDRHGVRLIRRRDRGTWIARWRDPVSNKLVQLDLNGPELGLTNAKKRDRWAAKKAEALREDRASIAATGAAASPMAVATAIEKYVAGFAKPNTRSALKAPLAALRAHLTASGIVNLQDLTGFVVAAFGDAVRDDTSLAVGSRNLRLSVALAFWRWCARDSRRYVPRVTDKQLKDGLQRIKAPRDRIEVLPLASIPKLLAALLRHDENERDSIAPLALVLLGSGMRYSEAAELALSEVDVAENVIRLGSQRTKTDTAREIELATCPHVADLLRRLRLQAGDRRGRVFPTLNRRKAEAARLRSMKTYGAPPWDWRMLRRTSASVQVCAAVHGPASVYLTAKRCGHSYEIAEGHYLNVYRGMKPATSIEAAGGFENEARAIVRAVGGADNDSAAAIASVS